MGKLNFDDGDGVWRTIGGKHIFIRDGESLSSAMKRSGKFKLSSKKKEVKDESKSFNDLANETNKGLTKDENKKFSNDELNEKYVERKKQMENWLDETNSGKLSKYEEEALKYEREKHGEKAYQDLKKEFERGDDTFRKASASDSNDKEEEKKKIGGWRINEQGKKEYYERELANNERGYWTKENGQRVFKENPNYKEDKKELNLSQRQKEIGEIKGFKKINENTILPIRENETEEQVVDAYKNRQKNYKEYLKSRDENRERIGVPLKDSELKDVSEELERLENYNSKDNKQSSNEYMNNRLRQKAYQKYLKEHPASKITFEDFKDLMNYKK